MLEVEINLLNKLGLTDAEAKVYLALLQNGSASGYEASKLSGVPRSKIYNILESLITKGFLLFSEAEGSNRYAAVAMKEISGRVKHETEATLKELANRLKDYPAKTNLDFIWHIREYDNVFAKCRSIIKHTQKELYLQIWAEDLSQIQKEVKALERKGVKLHIVYFGEDDGTEVPFKRFHRHGMLKDKQEEMGGRFITLVSDDQEAAFGQIIGEHTAEVIWTKSRPMIAMAAECVRHDIYFYKSMDLSDGFMAEKLGKDYEKIREVCDEN